MTRAVEIVWMGDEETGDKRLSLRKGRIFSPPFHEIEHSNVLPFISVRSLFFISTRTVMTTVNT